MSGKLHEEYQYIDMLKLILSEGILRQDRTGVGCKSYFDYTMKFDLSDNCLPVFTTRKIFTRGAIEELLWFIRGETDSKLLSDKKIHIWDGNTTRGFLDGRNLKTYPEGNIGTMYGYQWRNWGGDFKEHLKGNRTGIDQLAKVVDLIKNNPDSRRIILSAWNVSQLETGCLEPCHILVQFFVDTVNGTLSSKLIQRSADVCCGVPLNCISYSLLTILLANICKLKPKYFIWSGGDCHVYNNHIDNVKIQVDREPYSFPQCFINKDINSIVDIENMTISDFTIKNYISHPKLKYEMAV